MTAVHYVLAFTTLAVLRGCHGEVQVPAVIVQIMDGTGFNISIPEAGKEMMNFKYYISVNTNFKEAENLYCKGQVECISEKSRFKLQKQTDLKEGDKLYFYLIGNRKPESFQMERIYEVIKNEEGNLEFHEMSARSGIEKEGLWYQLDKMEETNP